MAVLIVRKALYILAAVLGGIYLIIGGTTRFSADAITLDLAAFIKVTGPLLIGLVCGAGVLEIVWDSLGQGNITRRRSARGEAERPTD
jgi:hypothetical protein